MFKNIKMYRSNYISSLMQFDDKKMRYLSHTECPTIDIHLVFLFCLEFGSGNARTSRILLWGIHFRHIIQPSSLIPYRDGVTTRKFKKSDTSFFKFTSTVIDELALKTCKKKFCSIFKENISLKLLENCVSSE